MQPYNSTDAPAIDRGVKARLRRLDRDLFLSFSKYAIHPGTGQPLPLRGRMDDGIEQYERRSGDLLLIAPAWHLWVRDSDGRIHLVNSYPAESGFGHREVAALEADAARFMTPSEIVEIARQRRMERDRKRRQEYRDRHADITKANWGRIRDLCNGKSGYRERRIISGPGMGSRGAATERILTDAREDGWELPDN